MKLLNRFSIRVKMFTLVGTLLTMMIGMAGFGYFKLQQIGAELHGIITEDIPLTEITTDITSKQFEAALLLERAIQGTNLSNVHAPNIQDLHSQISRINITIDSELIEAETLLRNMISHAISERLKLEEEALMRSLQQLKKEHLEYEKHVESFLELIEAGDLTLAQEQLQELQDKQELLLQHLKSALMGIEKLTENALLIAEEHEIEALNGMAIIGILSFILGGILSYLYTVAMTKPLQRAAEASNQLAEGNLSVSLETTGKDEIARLLNSMHHMASNLESTIHQVLSSSTEIASAASKVADTAEHAKATITTQHLNTDQVTLAMNEMTTTIQQIADNAGTAAMETENAQLQISSGQEAIMDNLQNIHTLTGQIKLASQEVMAAREQSNSIVAFVTNINDIAEQTNLLALNASIEAARAGEQGRGFSVVADEVRKLASKTQSTTSEIQTFVESLQSQTLTAAETIEKTCLMADSSSKQAEYCQKTFNTINRSVEELTLKNIEIATICEQQSAAAEEINRSMVSIGQSGSEVQSRSEQNSKASDDLSRLASELKQLMGRFSLRKAH